MAHIEDIYRRHASAVFRFAWGPCGDPSRAEDLVSETFVRLLTHAPRIRTRTALAYLLAIARNTYLTSERRRRREVALVEDLPAPMSDPGRPMDEQARLRLTVEALRGLPGVRGQNKLCSQPGGGAEFTESRLSDSIPG